MVYCHILALLEEAIIPEKKKGELTPKPTVSASFFHSFPSPSLPPHTPTHHLLLLTLCTQYREWPPKSRPSNPWELEYWLNEMLGVADMLYSITGYLQWISMKVNKHGHSHIIAIVINIWWLQCKPKSLHISRIKSFFTRNNSLQV